MLRAEFPFIYPSNRTFRQVSHELALSTKTASAPIVPLMEYSRRGNLAGVLFMLMGMLGMGLTDTAAKWLVSADYPVIQVIAIRGWFISAILLAWIVFAQQAAGLRTKRPWAHVLRLVVAFMGPVFMFRALQDMPLADVTVIVFGSTFMTTALSVPLFKEKVGLHRWGAVILGLIGVVIALRPGTEVFNPSALFALLAGLSFAGINLTARWLRDTESTFQLIFYLMIGITLLSSMALPSVWVTVEMADWAIFGAMGIFTIVGYIFMTRAFMVAPTGLVAPFEYTVLIWAVAFGFLVWGDVPDIYVWTGAVVIISSGLYLVHRESKHGGPEAVN